MPDTIFFPENAYEHLLRQHRAEKADLTLGLFPTQSPEKFGMVAFNAKNHMTFTVDKPQKTDLQFMWGIACWQPTFSEYMANYLLQHGDPGEIVLGDIFQSALESGFKVMVLPFITGICLDIGTPDDLAEAVSHFSRPVKPTD